MSELQQVLDSHRLIVDDYLRRFSLLGQNAEEQDKEWVDEFNKRIRLLQHVIAMGQEMLTYENEENFKSSLFYQIWYDLMEEVRERLWLFASHLPNNELVCKKEYTS